MRVDGIEYFNKTVCEFRELMGQKTFWRDEDAKHNATKVLGHLFFNLVGSKEEQERASITYQATMSEFTRRESLVAIYG